MRKGALAFAGYKKGEKDSTATPDWLYKELDSEFHFDFDPCPLNHTFNGLEVEWKMCNYVNPPYSDKLPWIIKSIVESRKGKTVVMLLPVDTSTGWFHDWIQPYCSKPIRFIRRRLTYPPNNTPAAYPSMIVVFKP